MPDSNKKPRVFYGYFIVAAVFCILLALVGSYVSFGVFLKPLTEAFGWSRGAVSGAPAMAWFVQGVSGIFMGKLSDRFGPRIIMGVGGFIVGLGFILLSRMNELWHLYVFFGFIIGFGVSGTYVVLTSTIARWFSTRRSLMTGIGIAGSGVGSMVIPVVVSNFIVTYDWRTAFLIIGGFIMVTVVLLSFVLRKDPASKGLEPYGASKVVAAEPEIRGITATGYDFSTAAKTRQFWMVAVILLFLGYCINVIQVHIVAHASDVGVPDTSAATVLSVLGATGIAGPILVGMMADKIGNRKSYLLLFAGMVACFIWLIPSGQLWQFMVFAVPYGFIFNGAIAMQAPLAAALFGTRSLGVIIGAISLGFCIGSSGGSYIPGFIFDASGSYRVAFIIAVVICIVNIVLLALLRPLKTKAK